MIQVRRAWWAVHRGWLPTCRMWRSFSGKELIFGFPPIRDKPKQTQSKSAHCRVSCRMFCSLVVGISVISIIKEEPYYSYLLFDFCSGEHFFFGFSQILDKILPSQKITILPSNFRQLSPCCLLLGTNGMRGSSMRKTTSCSSGEGLCLVLAVVFVCVVFIAFFCFCILYSLSCLPYFVFVFCIL